jgi:hypothetical protein
MVRSPLLVFVTVDENYVVDDLDDCWFGDSSCGFVPLKTAEIVRLIQPYNLANQLLIDMLENDNIIF